MRKAAGTYEAIPEPVLGGARTRVLLLVATVALLVRLFVAWAIPLSRGPGDANSAPDEAWQYVVVHAIADGHPATWGPVPAAYAAYLPSNYAVQAGMLVLLRSLRVPRSRYERFPVHDERFAEFQLARTGSVLLGVLGCLLVLLSVQWFTRSATAGLIAGLVAAVYPQFVFLSGYVNSDVFTFAAGAALVLAMARWARLGEAEAGLNFVGVAIGLVFLSKPNGYFLLPSTAMWLIWAIWHRRLRPIAAARAAAFTVLIAGPVLIWNGIRNHGDVLGLAAMGQLVHDLAHVRRGVAMPQTQALWEFGWLFGRSSFGLAGNMSLALPYAVYAAAALFFTVGLFALGTRLRTARPFERRAALWIGASALVNLVLVFFMSWFVDFQPQGRYAMLTVVLLAVAAVLGPRSRLWRAGALGFLALSTGLLAASVYLGHATF